VRQHACGPVLRLCPGNFGVPVPGCDYRDRVSRVTCSLPSTPEFASEDDVARCDSSGHHRSNLLSETSADCVAPSLSNGLSQALPRRRLAVLFSGGSQVGRRRLLAGSNHFRVADWTARVDILYAYRARARRTHRLYSFPCRGAGSRENCCRSAAHVSAHRDPGGAFFSRNSPERSRNPLPKDMGSRGCRTRVRAIAFQPWRKLQLEICDARQPRRNFLWPRMASEPPDFRISRDPYRGGCCLVALVPVNACLAGARLWLTCKHRIFPLHYSSHARPELCPRQPAEN